MMIDTHGQSKWAKKVASWEKANSFLSPVRHFLPPGFLPKVTAHIHPTSYGEVSFRPVAYQQRDRFSAATSCFLANSGMGLVQV